MKHHIYDTVVKKNVTEIGCSLGFAIMQVRKLEHVLGYPDIVSRKCGNVPVEVL
jgi:hypothetical protein